MTDLPLEQALVAGGDTRLALAGGSNKYGCPPRPDPALAAFGSSTASVISLEGFAAARRLHERFAFASGAEAVALYDREIARLREELKALCGVAPGTEVVLAASGTDLHLLATQLVGPPGPTRIVLMDPAETGTGVPAALEGRHFNTLSALGHDVVAGTGLEGAGACDVATVPVRRADGTLRSPTEMEAEFEALVTEAVELGLRVLLIVVDVSKTGLLVPGLAWVTSLEGRFPGSIDVLVDACQFRLAPPTLQAYLAHGFMVALTGSKFLTGPAFSGALFVPAPLAARLRARPLPRALAAYSARGDWPQGWAAAESLEGVANFGLLLRWEVALEELRAFRTVPPSAIAGFLRAFEAAVRDRLAKDPHFEPLLIPPLDRRPLGAEESWDQIPTIFPFLLVSGEPLALAATRQVYDMLGLEAPGTSPLRGQLGQPVSCGRRGEVALSALRLCASARLVVEAHRGGAPAVIQRALAVLDKTARLVRETS